MKVLIACEKSQIVCKAFRGRGHEAYSCDILPCYGGHPEWHIQKDVLTILNDGWDIMIAHPDCERLTVTANRWYSPIYSERFPTIHEEREKAIGFFMKLANAKIEKVAIENPIGIMSKIFKKPSQIIQPFQFGHPMKKSTCLWLKNLPQLIPTNIVEPVFVITKNGKKYSPLHYYSGNLPNKERKRVRSETFQGIADAMAAQWG
jgi:hypothetical protein